MLGDSNPPSSLPFPRTTHKIAEEMREKWQCAVGREKGNEERTGLKGYAVSLTPRIPDVSEMKPDASEMLGLQIVC